MTITSVPWTESAAPITEKMSAWLEDVGSAATKVMRSQMIAPIRAAATMSWVMTVESTIPLPTVVATASPESAPTRKEVRRSDPARQGEVLGVNQSASAMARILGPFIGLTLYKLEPSHLLPYGVGAGLILLMLPLLPAIRRGTRWAQRRRRPISPADLRKAGKRPR